jgi:archaellum component FlaC
MLNHKGSDHEHFEELCALAAGAQISEPEFVELQDHLQGCVDCRSVYADFMDLSHNKLPLADPEVVDSSTRPGFFSEYPSFRERFLARARRQGLAVLNGPAQRKPWRRFTIWPWPGFGYTQVATLAAAALLVVAGVLAYNLHQSDQRYMKLAADKAAMSQASGQPANVKGVESPASPTTGGSRDSSSANPAPIATDPAQATALRRTIQAENELARVRGDRASAEARAKAMEDQLARLASEMDALRAQNEKVNVSREELEQKLKTAEQVANAVKNNLQEIREARSKDSLTITVQDLEIQKLSEKLKEQTEILEQQTNLLEASHEVRDLMGARNFHIADVRDVDSKGKDQRAFGRVFYTEGKQTLIIYAFDLNDRNAPNRNASFQVWGKRGSAQSPTHSLVLFQIDDKKENRWVLRFEDPRILAEIDSVFVTVEPPGGSARPTGRQFLNAYLDTNPNRQ